MYEDEGSSCPLSVCSYVIAAEVTIDPLDAFGYLMNGTGLGQLFSFEAGYFDPDAITNWNS